MSADIGTVFEIIGVDSLSGPATEAERALERLETKVIEVAPWVEALNRLEEAGVRKEATLSELTPDQRRAFFHALAPYLPDWPAVWVQAAGDLKRHKRQQRDLRERQRWNRKRRRGR